MSASNWLGGWIKPTWDMWVASLQPQPLSQQGIQGNSELSARGRKGLSFIVYHLQIQRPQEKKVCQRGQSTVLFNQGRRAPWSRGYEGCADWRGQGSQWSPDSPLIKSEELRAPCCQPGQALRVESVGGLHVRTGATKQRLGVTSGEEAPVSPWRWTFQLTPRCQQNRIRAPGLEGRCR